MRKTLSISIADSYSDAQFIVSILNKLSAIAARRLGNTD
jgi:hypothetical protein